MRRFGKVIIGTVEGDIHNLAKDMVAFMLNASGFEVINLGVDVPPANFVQAVKETGARIVALSGFLTLAYDPMKATVAALREAGLDVKVMIGGGQVDDHIEMGLRSVAKSRNPFVFIPLHKGADSFMSDRDFKTFYWPTLKATILGLIEEGVVPSLLAEGSFNQRLGAVTDPDIPKGTTRWFFDQTDMKEVKKRFTGWACFGGNVPLSLLSVAKPEEISDCVKELIDNCAQDGGYILSTGAALDHARPENLRAMIETRKEYGRY